MHNTSRLFSTSGTFGEVQIVASQEHVTVDMQTRNYDTTGHLHCDHALANLSLIAAMRLRDLLDEAIDHAHGIALDTRQTSRWGGSPARR